MIIEARDITYRYKKHTAPVLDHASAAFDEGRFYAIVGESGSGKTTLLSLLAGLDVPAQGQILYEGVDIREGGLTQHRRAHVALVFQDYNLIDYLTVEENVQLALPGRVRRDSGLLHKFRFLGRRATNANTCRLHVDAPSDARALLAGVGLSPDCARKNVRALSGGQQQRVAIARALASPARVLLADEPTGNLDAATAHGIIQLLADTAHTRGKCVIAVTHSPALAEAADQVLRLADGKLTQA